MASTKIKFDESEVIAAAKRLNEAMSDELYQAVRPAVQPVLDDAKNNAPERTELMKNELMMGDINVTPTEAEIGVGFPKGTKAYYWWFVERGHLVVRGGNVVGRVSGRPFLQPALEKNKAAAKKEIKERLTRIVKGAIK